MTPYRFFCCLILITAWSTAALGQTIDTVALAEARRALDAAETLYSRQHIEYSKALLRLAAVNLQDELAALKWEDEAKDALRVIRARAGVADTAYAQGLALLPPHLAAEMDADLDLEVAKARFGQRSVPYAEALLKRALAYAYRDYQEQFPHAMTALALIQRLPARAQEPLRAKAAALLDPVVWQLVQQRAQLDQALATAPDALSTADSLAAYAKASLIHYEYLDDYIYLDSTYGYITQALRRYEKEWGTAHPRYRAAYELMTEEMRDYFRVEYPFLKRLERHETNSSSFLEILNGFVAVWQESYVPPYNEEEIYQWVLDDIRTHYGTQNKYYKAVLAMAQEDSQDAVEQAIAEQRTLFRTRELDLGASAPAYWQAGIDLALLYIKEVEEEAAYLVLLEVFGAIRKHQPSETLAGTLRQYLTQLPDNWQLVFVRQHQLVQTAQREGQSPLYWQQYFDWVLAFQSADILFEERGYDLLKKGIRTIPAEHRPIALRSLQQVLQDHPELQLFALRKFLPKALSLTELKTVIQPALDEIAAEEGWMSQPHAEALEILAEGYYRDDADSSAKEALQLYRRILTSYLQWDFPNDYITLLERITTQVTYERNPWKAQEAEWFFEQLLDHYNREEKLHEGSVAFLGRYGDWYYVNSQFVAAEQYLQQVIDYYLTTNVERGNNYHETKYKLARTLRKTGRYERAIELYVQLLHEAANAYDFLMVVRSSDDLGLLLQSRGNYEKALDFFDKALEQFEKIETVLPQWSRYNSKEGALLYVKLLRHKGRAYLDQGYLEEAEYYYDKIRRFEEEERSPVSFLKDVSLMADLATLAKLSYEYDTAAYYYQLALANLTDQEDLARTHLAFAEYHQSFGEDSLAASHMSQALAIDLERLQNNYTRLSEQERLLFLEPIAERVNQFLTFALNYPQPDILTQAFNAHLVIKGLALETSTNLQSVCNATENIVLRNKCLEMQNLRKTLSTTNLPLDEQRQLERAITALEKDIGRSSDELREIYHRNNRNVDFTQLKRILYNMSTETQNDLAVDFLIIPEKVHPQRPPVPTYYAVVVAPAQPAPQFVRLATAQELSSALAAEIAPNTLNYITDKVESAYLYQLLWEPLLPYIDSAQSLHLCPTGILSKVAFGTLVPDAYGRRRVMDDWAIHYYGALRDLLSLKQDEGLPESGNIVLVGGVQFSLPEAVWERRMQREGVTIPPPSIVQAVPPLASTNRALGSDFGYLPGTLSEVQAISQLFPSDWVVQLLSDTLATEENITDRVNASPTIVHIATHGYFFPTPEEDPEVAPQLHRSVQHRIARSNNPLIRSGLALAGINRVWNGGKPVKGIGDGIWTALEVSNLDLFNTQLVILSACETGRGDIDNHEGVMGLRRAFKTAGAQQLIISLWKVPDQQTAELMELFYSEYLQGQSAHDAFAQAQATMRTRYSNPYYWAAFLLIE